MVHVDKNTLHLPFQIKDNALSIKLNFNLKLQVWVSKWINAQLSPKWDALWLEWYYAIIDFKLTAWQSNYY